MNQLSHRSNFLSYDINGKPLLLYEDHRSLVYVLWHALHRAKVLDAPPLLVYFDRHDDAKAPSTAAQAAARSLRANSTEKDVFAFVEWDLGAMDDDWLRAAMEIGVVGDALLVGCDDPSNLQSFETIHTDHTGAVHHIWHIDHLWDALEYKGALTDTARSAEFSPLWRALGWDPAGRFVSDAPDVVLDFDLDCFAGHLAGCTVPWPPDIMVNSFRRPSKHLKGRMTAQHFLRALRDRSPFVTVARESPYCGGTAHSQQILETLDEIMWDGELFSRP